MKVPDGAVLSKMSSIRVSVLLPAASLTVMTKRFSPSAQSAPGCVVSSTKLQVSPPASSVAMPTGDGSPLASSVNIQVTDSTPTSSDISPYTVTMPWM